MLHIGVTRVSRPAGVLAAQGAVRWNTPFCYKEKVYHKIREKEVINNQYVLQLAMQYLQCT